MSILDKYTLKTSKFETGNGCWGHVKVEIFLYGKYVGEYIRNYPDFSHETFYPFIQEDGQEYALYSKDYTCTRVMKLPECIDLCGEESDAYGFCPVEFYVPDDKTKGFVGNFGFVAGCIWGDDSSWKIEYLDLSKIKEGIFHREGRFGYFEKPHWFTLKEAVNLDWYDDIPILRKYSGDKSWDDPIFDKYPDDEKTISLARYERFDMTKDLESETAESIYYASHILGEEKLGELIKKLTALCEKKFCRIK